MHGFTCYGTGSEVFAVCQGCASFWLIQGEGLTAPRIVESIPDDAEYVDSNELPDDLILPACCDLESHPWQTGKGVK